LASWGAFAPAFASAGMLSLFSSLISQSQASAPYLNSQTLPLLTPAINIDPHPPIGGGDIAVVNGMALLAQDSPSGLSADAAPSSAISVYTVHPGDTLSGIAKMFGITVGTIVGANDLQGKSIHAGDTLIILPITGVRYTLLKGDTLASIAKKFKGDEQDILQYNNLPDASALAVGDTIIIPDGEVTQIVPVPKVRVKVKIGTEPYLGGSGPAITGYYGWPVDGGVITQGLHGWNGVDIGAPTGTSIFAAAEGVVIVARAGGYNGGYGSYVVVQHQNGTQTLYAHMSKVLVDVGTEVAQGTTLGRIGATGKATGPHLHFEVRGAVNPFAQ
jgi:LysM repeat protein